MYGLRERKKPVQRTNHQFSHTRDYLWLISPISLRSNLERKEISIWNFSLFLRLKKVEKEREYGRRKICCPLISLVLIRVLLLVGRSNIYHLLDLGVTAEAAAWTKEKAFHLLLLLLCVFREKCEFLSPPVGVFFVSEVIPKWVEDRNPPIKLSISSYNECSPSVFPRKRISTTFNSIVNKRRKKEKYILSLSLQLLV